MKSILFLLFLFPCVPDFCFAQGSYPFRSNDKEAISAYWYNCKDDTVIEAAIKDTAIIHSTFQIYGPVVADSFLVEAEIYNSMGTKSYTNKFQVRKDMKSTNFKTEILQNYFLITVPVAQLRENPEKIRIILSSPGKKLDKWINCKYHKLHGNFSDFQGHAVKSYILIRSDGFENVSGVWSDPGGYYEIYLPERTYNCFYVNDGNYKSTSLEAWAWHMIVDEDQKLDFKIGTAEVYNLNVWPNNGGPNSLLISFRPMALYHNQSTDSVENLSNKNYKIIDIAPDLDLSNITVTLNGNQTNMYTLQKYYETGKDWGMPAYIVQVRRLMPCFGKQTIRVEYEKIIEMNGKKVLQNSMGYFQFYPNFYGYSSFN